MREMPVRGQTDGKDEEPARHRNVPGRLSVFGCGKIILAAAFGSIFRTPRRAG